MPLAKRPSEAYRLYAAHCLKIAQEQSDIVDRLALIQMAQAWIDLSVQAEKNAGTALVYEPPGAHRQPMPSPPKD